MAETTKLIEIDIDIEAAYDAYFEKKFNGEG